MSQVGGIGDITQDIFGGAPNLFETPGGSVTSGPFRGKITPFPILVDFTTDSLSTGKPFTSSEALHLTAQRRLSSYSFHSSSRMHPVLAVGVRPGGRGSVACCHGDTSCKGSVETNLDL